MNHNAPGHVTFLLGAGASISAGIPNVIDFVTEFRRELVRTKGEEHEQVSCLADITAAWEAAANNDIGLPKQIGLERLYELLIFLGDHDERSHSIPLNLPADFPRWSRAMELLAWDLKKFVQKRCLGFVRSDLGYLDPLLKFVDSKQGLDILSLNYDTCIETLMDTNGVQWTDGFPDDGSARNEFSSSITSLPSESTVRLLKLHGSASWYRDVRGGVRRILASSQSSIGLMQGYARTTTNDAVMIYPTLNKALVNGPFPRLMLEARQILARSRLLLACGYGFEDSHIQDLVVDSMERNPSLQLVLVNPQPHSIIEGLTTRALELAGRIGVCGDEEGETGEYPLGYIEKALGADWLLSKSRQWIAGRQLHDPLAKLQQRSSATGRPWSLRYEVADGVGHLALGERVSVAKAKHNEGRAASTRWVIWVVTRERQRLISIDLQNGSILEPDNKLFSPRGVAWDEVMRELYLVENVYHASRGWPVGTEFAEKVGLGRLWRFDLYGRRVKPLTRANLRAVPSIFSRAVSGDKGLNEILGEDSGILIWPTRVKIQVPGESVLITEARNLARLSLKNATLTHQIRIPLCFNLIGISLIGKNDVLLTDAGVHPHGQGRLMQANLETGNVVSLLEGPQRMGDVLWHKESGLVLISIDWHWPNGRVIGFRSRNGRLCEVASWNGLDSPGSLINGDRLGTAFVGTAKGVVELRLD